MFGTRDAQAMVLLLVGDALTRVAQGGQSAQSGGEDQSGNERRVFPGVSLEAIKSKVKKFKGFKVRVPGMPNAERDRKKKTTNLVSSHSSNNLLICSQVTKLFGCEKCIIRGVKPLARFSGV
jgi:hypothetical protein